MIKESKDDMSQTMPLHKVEKELVLAEGKWSEGVSWKFVVSEEELEPQLCTAVFCAVTYQGRIIIVNHDDRGWELPGGHIDEGETIKDALLREVLEETGAVIDDPKMFGYKRITSDKPVSHRSRPGEFYPFPDSYIPYYIAEASEIYSGPLSSDVIEVKLVRLGEARKALAMDHKHDVIVNYLAQNSLITVRE